MALISRGDLYYKDYSWTTVSGDDPRVTGKPDSTLFNSHEGYEVLYLINKFVEKHDLKQKSSGTKVEKMIRNELPSTTRSQENVVTWLEQNWKKNQY